MAMVADALDICPPRVVGCCGDGLRSVPGMSATDGLAQRDLGAESQFFARSRRAGHVAVHRGARLCLGSDMDVGPGWQRGGDFAREGRDAQSFFGADVIGAAGFSVEKNGPEPDHQIRGVKVGAHRGAVSLDANWAIAQTIGDEVTDGKVRVELHVWSD